MTRYVSENIYSVNDSSVYVVYIDDAEHASSSTQFKVSASGFTLRQDGENGGAVDTVVATEFSMAMYIQNATHAALIADLAAAPEGRFKVRVTKDAALHYVGNVVVDLGSYEDRAYPYNFTIKATDLAGLANIDYNDGGAQPYEGWETLLSHIGKCLDKTGLTTFGWSGTDIMLSTAADWYEDTMSTGPDKDPLALARCNHRAFFEAQKGGYKYMTALDVLRQLAGLMDCQLKQSNGRFRLFQAGLYTTANVRWRHYDRSLAYRSNSLDAYTLDISAQGPDGAKLAGGDFSWLPQVKRAALRYRHRNWVNLIEGQNLDGTPFATQEISSGNGSVVVLATLNINRTLFNATNPVGTPFVERYTVQIQVGPKYLVRNMTNFANGSPQYSAPIWQGSPGHYHFHLANGGTLPELGQESTLNSVVAFTSPPLTSEGVGSVNVSTVGIFTNTGAISGVSVSSFAASPFVVSGSLVIADYSNGPYAVTDTLYTATSTTAAATAINLDMATQIGDGTTANSFGKIQVYNAATLLWEDSGNWRIGGSGSGKTLQRLRVQELIARRNTNVPIMRHTVGYAHGYEPHMRIDDGQYIWAFLGGTFTARYNDWQGTWYRATYSPTGIDVLPGVEVPSGGGIPDTKTPTVFGGTITTTAGTSPDIPKTPGIPGGGTFDVPPLEGIILSGIAGTTTTTAITPGSVSSIPVANGLAANAYLAGQQISVIDPIFGVSQQFTVAANTLPGATSIPVVAGYAVNTLGAGSYVVTTGANGVQAGLGQGTATAADPSEWWAIFGTSVLPDDTLDTAYPVQADDIVLDTDPDAGNGSTAGIRFDGDGLQSWPDNSTTPGVKVDKVGGMEINSPITADDIVLDTDPDAGDGMTPGLRLDGDGLQSWQAISATPTAKIDKAGGFDFRSHPNAGNGSTAGIRFDPAGLQGYKSTAAATTFYLLASGGWQFRSTPLVGNGSTAGLRITDTGGVEVYKATSATPTFKLNTDGTVTMNHAAHPTVAAGIVYVNNGVLYIDHDGAGTKVAPQYGHVRPFNVIGVNTAWTTGTKDAFWRVTSEYAGLQIWQVGYGVGSTGGSGASTNQCQVYHLNQPGTTTTSVLLMTCDTAAQNQISAATNLVTLAAGDMIYFNVSSIRATPAQGLYVELYLRKA